MLLLCNNMVDMGKKKQPFKDRSHSVTIDIPERKYQRWAFPYKDRPRVILIDFRCIRTTPWHPVDYGARRAYKWNNPQQLKQLVDEYFQSCYGPIRNPKGGFFYEPDGSLTIGQCKPFTISGLALFTHIDTSTLRRYKASAIDALGVPVDSDYSGPSYSEIMLEAVKKVENYAEERLYDRDGFGGGRFVLDAAFGWQGKKEAAETKSLKKQDKLKADELKFRKEQAALGDDIEEPVTITIKRASIKEDTEES